MAEITCAQVWMFKFVPLIYHFFANTGLFYDYSPVILFEVWYSNPLCIAYLLRVALAIQGLLFFHINWWVVGNRCYQRGDEEIW